MYYGDVSKAYSREHEEENKIRVPNTAINRKKSIKIRTWIYVKSQRRGERKKCLPIGFWGYGPPSCKKTKNQWTNLVGTYSSALQQIFFLLLHISPLLRRLVFGFDGRFVVQARILIPLLPDEPKKRHRILTFWQTPILRSLATVDLTVMRVPMLRLSTTIVRPIPMLCSNV